MRRVLLALAPAFLAAAYLAAFFAVAAQAPASPLETAAAERGHDVLRAAASPLPALAQERADVVVLAAPHARPAAEQRALLRFAESGGTVVLVGAAPPARLAEGVRVHPGVVYAADGGPAALDAGRDVLPGARSLDLEGSAFSPLARTTTGSFRDSDGDARLTLGEPAGPFVVAAQAAVGAGRVVLVAAEDADDLALAPTLLDAALGPEAARVVLVEAHGAWAAPARIVAHAAALSSASLLAAAALLLAAGGVLAWLMGPRDESEARIRSTMERLVSDYQSTLARKAEAPASAVPPGDDHA
ncbi:MAG TPA: DUF4350 domain-containing protein [Candidatus Thermoplasmatota archaeon]|nr:DUF4350 domain-containing protein [Candidatus Thermoplasmatota archaeon]